MDNGLRTDTHKRPKGLDELLAKVNGLLEETELREISELTEPKLPAVFIVGNPRSGTTLLYQWLAASGLFAYPSNIISRFYNAPYIGALIHKIFIDFDKYGELCGIPKFEFTSQLGKTSGAHSPHEFWYFWRRFFHFGEIQMLNKKELDKVNHELFLKELAAIENCFQKPLLLKALIMNWNIDYLNQLVPKPLFLFIKRNEIANMASLFKSRILFFKDTQKWYSFKPPEYEKLKTKNIYTQLAGQVYFTNKFIEDSLEKINPRRRITIPYEKFCENPEEHYHLIISRLQLSGFSINKSYAGPNRFKPSINFPNEFNVSKAKDALSCIWSS